MSESQKMLQQRRMVFSNVHKYTLCLKKNVVSNFCSSVTRPDWVAERLTFVYAMGLLHEIKAR